MLFKVNFHISYNYGGWDLSFTKRKELEFVPFYDLCILEQSSTREHLISLKNNDYLNTVIYYIEEEYAFNVDIRHIWKSNIDPNNIYEVIELHSNLNWIRTDNTNIKEFKKLLQRDNQR